LREERLASKLADAGQRRSGVETSARELTWRTHYLGATARVSHGPHEGETGVVVFVELPTRGERVTGVTVLLEIAENGVPSGFGREIRTTLRAIEVIRPRSMRIAVSITQPRRCCRGYSAAPLKYDWQQRLVERWPDHYRWLEPAHAEAAV
jgi:hypothetical protein